MEKQLASCLKKFYADFKKKRNKIVVIKPIFHKQINQNQEKSNLPNKTHFEKH